MDYEIDEFVYNPLRKGFELRGKLGTQVRWVPLRLNTPAEEFYRVKGSNLPVSEVLQKVPAEAQAKFVEHIISHLEGIIGTPRNVCELDLIVHAWNLHIKPHCGLDCHELPQAMVSVRVSTERLQEESQSQLTTARQCLKQALRAGWFPRYITWDTWTGAEIDRVGIRLAIELAHHERIHHLLFANMTRSSRNILDGLIALTLIRCMGVRIWIKPRDEFEFHEADVTSSVRIQLVARELGMGQAEWANNIMNAQRTSADRLLYLHRWPAPRLGNKLFHRIPVGSVWKEGWAVEVKQKSASYAPGIHALIVQYGRKALQSVAYAVGREPYVLEAELKVPLLHGSLVTPAAAAIENMVPGLAVYTRQAHHEIMAAIKKEQHEKPRRAGVDPQDYRRDIPLGIRHLASGGLETIRCPHCPTHPPMEFGGRKHEGVDLVFRYECPHGHSVTLPDAPWSLKLESQLTPFCPTCSYHPCREAPPEKLPVYHAQFGRVTTRRLYWYVCPQCRIAFSMPWKFKRSLVREWARTGRLQPQVEKMARENGWDVSALFYEKPRQRKYPTTIGADEFPSSRGYWTMADLIHLCARHIEAKPRMRHTIVDVALAMGKLPDVGTEEGRIRMDGIRELLERAHLVLERVHGRHFVNWWVPSGNGRVLFYEMEEKL